MAFLCPLPRAISLPHFLQTPGQSLLFLGSLLRTACRWLSGCGEEPAILGDQGGAPVQGGSGGKPTFDGHVDALADGELRLDEDTA